MLKAVSKFIKENQLLGKNQSVVVAVSGGVDSMVLMDVLSKLGYQIIVVHCNFSLRGKDSDEDEKFVEEKAKKYSKNIFVNHFDTKQYAKENKLSVEEAARNLRYGWFKELCKKYQCPVAVAHHLDDQIETFYFKLIRGTGIKGLHAMLPKNENIIRPMLEIPQAEIENYAIENAIEWHEDKSNESDDYTRNYIRHHLTPIIHKLNKNYYPTFLKELENFRSAENIYNHSLDDFLNQNLKVLKNRISLPLLAIESFIEPKTLLHHWLNNYGFDYDAVINVSNSIDKPKTSQEFHGKNGYILIKERENLVLIRTKSSKIKTIIEKSKKSIDFPIQLQFEEIKNTPNLKIDKCHEVAYLDMEKLKFPLQIRQWQAGDYFYPLGMSQKKKLSDFFIDNKIEKTEKMETFLLCSGNEIAWLIGHRIDNRFKITAETKRILKINIY